MKRSGITRKKPWRPKPCELKRKKPINRESKKHRQQRSRISKEDSPREQYRKLHPKCQLCSKRKTRDIHEIAKRSKHVEAVEHRFAWLALCGPCHDRCENYGDMPLARQYALKQRVDPKFYDRIQLNLLRGRKPEAISQDLVDEWGRIDMETKVDESKVKARVAGRKMAVELSSLIPGDDFNDPNFMESCLEELKDMAGIAPPVNIEVVEQMQPIGRLAATEVPFGVHKGKSFDDVPLTYLDWLCREQEGFYRNLRAYLKHPDLKSRRRGID